MNTVLIVDDDEVALRYLPRLLAPAFEVIVADAAAGGRAALGRGRVDVVVTELELGAESGLSLLAYARAMYPRTRRILISGRDMQEVHATPDAAPFDRFLPKPFALDDLVRALRDSLSVEHPLVEPSPWQASRRARVA